MVRRALAALISASLIVLSPGLAPYAAAGQQFSSRAGASSAPQAAPAVSVKTLALPAFSGAAAPLGLQTGLDTSVALPSAAVPAAAAAASLPAAGAAGAAAAKPVSAPSSAAAAPLTKAVLPSAQPAGAAQSAARAQLSAVGAQIGRTLQNAGDLSRAEPASAHAAGAQVQDLLSGSRSSSYNDSVPVAAAADMSALGGGPSLSYAKPAGRDSIVDAAEAYFGGAPNVPAPPSNNNTGGNDNNGNNGGNGGGQAPKKAPLVPRILSAVLALAPAALIGWPLVAGGSLIAGSLVVLGSVGVAALPFMSERTPAFARSLPGFVIVALGVTTLAGGLSTGALALSMGAVVALGGWGFVRFARTTGRKYDSPEDLIAAFFGSLAAVTGAGLALLHPAGLIATVLTVAAYPTTLALYMYLPGWVGASLESVMRGIDVSVRDSHKVLSSVRHDTVLANRLQAYTRASLKASPWNAVWLGLLVWLPVVVVEGASSLIGVVHGLALGVVRAPVMLLWGAAHKIAPQSAATRFFAGWARSSYFINKPVMFNAFEAPLLKYANSKSRVVSVLGALGIRFLQAGYLLSSAFWTPLTVAFGWIDGIREAAKPNDDKRHDPDSLSLGSDPFPSQVPSEDDPTATVAWPGKLMATAIGLSPLALLGSPLLGAGVLGWGMIAAIATIGLMPVMPKSAALSAGIRRLPGTILSMTGLFAALGAARYALIGLPTGWILGLGVLAFMGGIGLRALIDKLRDSKTSVWQLDEPEYIGGFVSALAMAAALGAAMLGVTGPLMLGLGIGAAVLSPLLLYHLPTALWSGVGAALLGLFSPIRKIWDVMGFWRDDAQFNRNLNAWYRYWTGQSGWYAAMFLVPWALTLVSYAVEAALSLGVGLIVGVSRIPANFAWGWAYEKQYDGKSARFWTGFNRFLSDSIEGSKKTRFDPLVSKLIPAMDAKNAVSSRPTLGALLALSAARLAQLGWLAYVLLATAVSPVLWLFAISAGKKSDKASRPRSGLFD
jgi:hypothetical protein